MNYDKRYEGKDPLYFGHNRIELLPFIPEKVSTALDIGCGNGTFGALLKETYKEIEVWGVEPDKGSASQAKEKLDIVINDLFHSDHPEFSGQKFDVIFFNDVLEHLNDPTEALAMCKNLLTPNGHIIASIPNIRWYPVILSLLRYKDFKYTNAGVMDKTHLRFFTKKSMIRLFEESGYHVDSIQGINKSTDFKFFNLLNFLLLGQQEDMAYPQFVTVASLK